jgi:peptidoglycan/xylan/chitin deacetylase (PgdA/CDA1 family)
MDAMLAFAATVTALGAATWAGFQTMWPTSQVYGRTFCGVEPGTKLIALTYDDGPNAPHTPHLLDVLNKHDAKVTFFMIGRYLHERPDIARAVAAAGHEIGNHTYTHPNLIFCSRAQIEAQIRTCTRMLEDTVGAHSNLFRPPFGGRRPEVLSIARRLGLMPVMWGITAFDWNPDPAAVIVDRVSRRVRGGDVVLMHDGGHLGMGADRAQTVIATDRIISRYKSEGYRFVTVSEMMAAANSAADLAKSADQR